MALLFVHALLSSEVITNVVFARSIVSASLEVYVVAFKAGVSLQSLSRGRKRHLRAWGHFSTGRQTDSQTSRRLSSNRLGAHILGTVMCAKNAVG